MAKATGILRRIDDLGRVVIPKEIRRTMRIHEGDQLELFIETINGQPAVCFTKYEIDLKDEITDFFDLLRDNFGYEDTIREMEERCLRKINTGRWDR